MCPRFPLWRMWPLICTVHNPPPHSLFWNIKKTLKELLKPSINRDSDRKKGEKQLYNSFSRLYTDQSMKEIIDEWLISFIFWTLKNDLSYTHCNSKISFNHSECVCFFKNISHLIKFKVLLTSHLSVSYSIHAFPLLSLFCLSIIILYL